MTNGLAHDSIVVGKGISVLTKRTCIFTTEDVVHHDDKMTPSRERLLGCAHMYTLKCHALRLLVN